MVRVFVFALVVVTSMTQIAFANVPSVAPSMRATIDFEKREPEKIRKLREFSLLISPEADKVQLPYPIVREAAPEQRSGVKILAWGDPRLLDFRWELHVRAEDLVGMTLPHLRYQARYMVCKVEWARHVATYGPRPAGADLYYMDQCVFVKYPESEQLEYVALFREVRADALRSVGMTNSKDQEVLQMLIDLYRPR